MVSAQLIQNHLQDRVEDLALHRSQYKELSDEDWAFFLQQIEGYQRTVEKLPTFASQILNPQSSIPNPIWWYPPRISCEQCSSEATARYKAGLLGEKARRQEGEAKRLIDLTGGAGVDTYFLSEQFDTVDYVEQNEELCRLAQHNLPQHVSIHNCSAEHYLDSPIQGFTDSTTIFVDPSRRDKNGSKVFRLADCTPNVAELLPKMREVADTILIKLSPMLDITQALRELGDEWQVHVVAVKNEVKEILLVHNAQCTMHNVTCVDLAENWKFEFTREEETNAECTMQNAQFTNLQIEQFTNYYLYEPSPAILKAGAYKLVGARYGLEKLGVNTHLYVSVKLMKDFPGRCWRILGVQNAECTMHNEKANVLTRNYPLSAEQLKKKLHVKDGGEKYIIGTRVGEKPVVLFAERI